MYLGTEKCIREKLNYKGGYTTWTKMTTYCIGYYDLFKDIG